MSQEKIEVKAVKKTTYKKNLLKFPLSIPLNMALNCLKKNNPSQLNSRQNYYEQLPDMRISYGGSIDKDGNLEAYMHCSGFDGCMTTSGKVLEVKTLAPELVNLVIEYNRQKIVQNTFEEEEFLRERKRMDEIYHQMFGKRIIVN